VVGGGENVEQTYIPDKVIARNAGFDFLVDQALKSDGKSRFAHRKVGSGISS
jgi:hypothetical protein